MQVLDAMSIAQLFFLAPPPAPSRFTFMPGLSSRSAL